MPNDGIVVIGTKVDLAGLRRGMAEAQIDVRSASADMSSAYKQLGAAARSGSRQATEALIEQQDALNAAKERLSQFAAAQKEVAGSTRSMTSTFYAAQGASAELRGAIPYRALERFLADIPGVSTALMAAFPVIGAVALGQVLVDAGAKAINFYEDVVNLKSAMRDLNDLDLSVTSKVKQLAEETEQAHVRFIELTQGTEAAAKERERYAGAKSIDLTGFFSSKQIREMTDRVKGGFEDAYKTIDPAQLDSKIAQIKAKMTEIQDVISNPMKHRTIVGTSRQGPIYAMPDEMRAQAELKLVKEIDKQLEAEAAKHTETMKMLKAEATKAGESESSAGTASRARISALHVYGRTPIESAQKRAAAEMKKLADMAAPAALALQTATAAVDRFNQASENATLHHLGKPFDDAHMQSLRDGQRALESVTRSQDEYIRMKERMGLLTPQGAIQAERDTENGGYTAEHKQLTDMRGVFNSRLSAQAGMEKGTPGYDPSLPGKIQQINSQIEALDRQHNQRLAQLDLQSQQIRLGYAKQYMDAVRMDLTNSVSEWLQGTRTFGEAMRQMFDQMALQAIESFAQIKLAAFETWALNKIFGEQSAAAQLTTTLTTNTLIAQSNAAVAATAALASTANPAYAAAIFAIGESFAGMASFDKGTSYVPRDGVAMLHRGETVLPPPQTEALTRALSGKAGGGGRSVDNSIGTLNMNYHGGRESGPDELYVKAYRFLRQRNQLQ